MKRVVAVIVCAVCLGAGIGLGYFWSHKNLDAVIKDAYPAAFWSLAVEDHIPIRIETYTGRVEVFDPRNKVWIPLGEESTQFDPTKPYAWWDGKQWRAAFPDR